ncbi:MAG: hypothetical protein ACHQ7M_14980 [Chloroflexota bacterium]
MRKLSLTIETGTGKPFNPNAAGAFGPGHHRGIDPFTPVWYLFDLLPQGRGEWLPGYAYR